MGRLCSIKADLSSYYYKYDSGLYDDRSALSIESHFDGNYGLIFTSKRMAN